MSDIIFDRYHIFEFFYVFILMNVYKNSCVHNKQDCNIIRPYSDLELHLENPFTGKKYTSKEKSETILKLGNKCKINGGTMGECCDKNDKGLEKLLPFIPKELRDSFPKIKIENDINNQQIYKVCPKNTDCKGYRSPTVYEMCKLQPSVVNADNVPENMRPDCLTANCNTTQIKTMLSKNEMDNADEHLLDIELVRAVKADHIDKLKMIFAKNPKQVNKVLSYGYPGNTLLHEALYRKSKNCAYYILENSDKKTLEFKNVDGNTPFQIACLKEDKEMVNMLLKIGIDRFSKNKYGDTGLHSAIRTGNEEIVRFLLFNGLSLFEKNEKGETPLFTAVTTVKKNINIIKLLCENGSDIVETNNKGKSCLKAIKISDDDIVAKEIETYLIRGVYNIYSSDAPKYQQVLLEYPEFSPYETVDSEEAYDEDDVQSIKVVYDQNIRNNELYKTKYAKPKKVLPDSAKKYLTKNIVETFEVSANNNRNHLKSNLLYLTIIIILIIAYFVNRIY